MDGPQKRFDVVTQLALLRRYARSLTRHHADAEDLMQDTLVHAYEHRASFVPGSDLRAWLLRMAHNLFVDGWRSRQARVAREEQAAAPGGEAIDGAQEHALELQEVRAAFLALPADQRAAFHLVVVEEMSYAEAAAILDVPLGTLMSRLGRARLALRGRHAGKPRAEPLAEARSQPRHLRVVGGRHEEAV